MDITVFLLAIVSAMLINNVILAQFLGICPFLGVSKNLGSSIGMSGAVVFVIFVAAAITWPLYQLLVFLEIEYMSTLVFILVIASLVQLIEMVIKKTSKGLYKSLGVYLPLITTNCAVLGVAKSNMLETSYVGALFIALGTGLGFALIMLAFSAIRNRLETSNVPEAFKGIPIALITASIMALAFLGISGMIS